MSESTGSGARRRRVLRWLLAAPIALWLLYLAAANFLLATEVGHSWLNPKPEKLSVSWRRAWTWFPGVIHLRDVRLEGRSRRAEWSATIDRGRMVVWLPSLAGRHFRLLRGVTDGAEIRLKLAPPPETPRPAKKRRGWRVTLAGLDVRELRSLEVGEQRLEGPGRLRGTARFEVRGPAHFALDELSLPAGRLISQGVVVADPVRLQSRVYTEPFVVGEDTVEDILAGASGAIDLEATADQLGLLGVYLEAIPWLELGGGGQLTAHLEATDGWLAPGSELLVEGPRVSATFFGLKATGAGRISGTVPEGASNAVLEAVLDQFDVVREADEAGLLHGSGLRVRLTNDTAAIDRPASGIALDLTLPPADVPDLAVLSAYLPEATGIELRGGSARLAAEMRYDSVAKVGDGQLDLSIDQLDAEVDDLDLSGRLRLAARFPRAVLDEGRLDLAGTELDIEDVTIRDKDKTRQADWWGRFEVVEGQVLRIPGEDLAHASRIDARVTAELRDTGPIVRLVERRVPKLGWFDRFLTVTGVKADSWVRIEGPSLDLSRLEVTGGKKGRLELLGELELEKDDASGVFFARWGKLSAAVALDDGERDWKLIRSRAWYLEHAGELARTADAPAAYAPPSGGR